MKGLPPGYDIVRYHPGLKAEMLSLIRPFWGSDDRLNEAYFSWKYEANPHVPTPQVYLATYHGKLVGIRGFLASTWEAAGLARYPLQPNDDSGSWLLGNRDGLNFNQWDYRELYSDGS